MFRKKVVAVLAICLMFVACFFMCDKNVVSTASAQPQKKTKEVEEYVNLFTDKEKEMMEEYKKGNAYTSEYTLLRKEKATKYGLLDYCDPTTYFLNDDFYDNYSDAYLIKDGLMILDRYSAGFEDAVNIMEPRSASVISTTHHRYEEKPGYYIANSIWKLSNSHEAFCAQGLNASPAVGDMTSDPYLVENENLKKCLYYGYNGPGDILTARYGVSSAIVLTSELVSNAYSSNCISKASNDGYHWNKVVGGLWNEITSKPNVKNYEAYLVDVAGSAYNWQGVLTSIQKLTYGVYVPRGSVQVKCISGKDEINRSNSSYTFSGALYGLYKDSSCKEKIGEFKIDKSGKSNVISDLDVGTYYLNEILASHGYQKDTTIYTVKVEDKMTTEIETRNTPQTNLVDLILVKQDAETGNKAQGTATFKDAKYEFKFYGGLYDDDPAKKGVTPLRKWIFKTDKTGKILMTDEFKVDGDSYFTDLNGKICLPLGTITVKEISPPQGYLLDKTVYTQKLDRTSSTSEHISVFRTFSVKDQVSRLKLIKVQEGTDVTLPDVTFKHQMPALPFPLNEKTNSKGEFELIGIAKGKHTLTEFKTLEGYVLDSEPIEFEVLEDGTIKSHPRIKNGVIRFENKVTPYTFQINKKNSKGDLINGARFALYKDAECKQLIAEKEVANGIVTFDNLENKTKYYYKETKAPEGYLLNSQVHEIYTDFIPIKGQFDTYINSQKKTNVYANGIVSTDIINWTRREISPVARFDKLPNTGSAVTVGLVLVGIILMFVAKRKD